MKTCIMRVNGGPTGMEKELIYEEIVDKTFLFLPPLQEPELWPGRQPAPCPTEGGLHPGAQLAAALRPGRDCVEAAQPQQRLQLTDPGRAEAHALAKAGRAPQTLLCPSFHIHEAQRRVYIIPGVGRGQVSNQQEKARRPPAQLGKVLHG